VLTFYGGCQQVWHFCPKKSYHGPFFNDGAIGKRSVHVCTVTASAGLTMQCWAMRVETCRNRVTTGYKSAGCYRWWWYSLNSQIAFNFWITLVITACFMKECGWKCGSYLLNELRFLYFSLFSIRKRWYSTITLHFSSPLLVRIVLIYLPRKQWRVFCVNIGLHSVIHRVSCNTASRNASSN
jgi:hypothetical protein